MHYGFSSCFRCLRIQKASRTRLTPNSDTFADSGNVVAYNAIAIPRKSTKSKDTTVVILFSRFPPSFDWNLLVSFIDI
jgi:hypothetical protein